MIVVLIILIDGFVTPQTPGSLLEPATQYIFPANVSLLDVTRLNIFRHFMSSPEKSGYQFHCIFAHFLSKTMHSSRGVQIQIKESSLNLIFLRPRLT